MDREVINGYMIKQVYKNVEYTRIHSKKKFFHLSYVFENFLNKMLREKSIGKVIFWCANNDLFFSYVSADYTGCLVCKNSLICTFTCTFLYVGHSLIKKKKFKIKEKKKEMLPWVKF